MAELMIALVLSMLIVLGTTSLLVNGKAIQSMQFDVASTEESAQFALNNIARSVRQAGFINFDRADAPIITTDTMSPAITGLDNATLTATTPGIESPSKSTDNASDVLAIRFYGSGDGKADNSILNCGGFGIAAPTSQSAAEMQRGWSIYYVARDARNQPNLYCKFKNNSFTAQPIAQGVESFQVLYGIETGSAPENRSRQFLSASELNAMDARLPALEINKLTNWKRVTAVKIALMIRGTTKEIGASNRAIFHLFGEDYSNTKGDQDQGTKILASDIPIDLKGNTRKIVGTTIQLRNSGR